MKLSHKYWPAKFLNGADINNSIVKMIHKLGHVLVQEPLVGMHRVSCKKRTIIGHECRSKRI